MITKQSAFLQNRATILEFLYRNPATSRTDIVNETGLTPATTTNIIKELSEQSLIYETGDEFSEFSGSGRRRKTISITDNIPYVVGGIEINVLGIFLSLCDLQGKTLFETEILNEDYPISEINSTITNMIKTAIEYVPLETKLLGFGLSIPGHYNKDSGSIITNNPIWEFFNLLNVIKDFNFPFIVKNNIDCMAIGQYLLNPHNTPDNFIFLHAGLGIYTSFFTKEKIGASKNPYIGEIGHTIVELNGQYCECGKKGCLQTYISDAWLIKHAQLLFKNSQLTVLKNLVKTEKDIHLDTLLTAYNLGDSALRQQIDKGVNLLATSIANLLLINPADKIYINSQLLNYQPFTHEVRDKIQDQLHFVPFTRNIEIEILPYNKHRGSIGACALAIVAFFIEHSNVLQDIISP